LADSTFIFVIEFWNNMRKKYMPCNKCADSTAKSRPAKIF
jgi:hypothetical protein